MSNRTAFFDALTEELPDDVWGNRLHAELAAHLEDAVYFGALQGKNETASEEQALADLGSPHLILQEFRHAMTYKSTKAFYLHALATGLLATPLIYLAMIATHTAIFALPVFVTLFSYYRLSLAPLLRHIEGRAMRSRIISIVTLIPSLVVGVPMILATFGAQISEGDRMPLIISFIIGIILTVISAATAAWEIDWEQRHPPKKTTAIGAIQKNIIVILCGTGIVFAVAMIAMAQIAPSSMSAIAKIHFIISTGLAAPNALVAFLSPITAGWISGIVITGAGLISLGFIIRSLIDRSQKKDELLPWGWIIVALLTIPLVVFPPKVTGIKNITWTDIPHTNISETIERAQLGPFYRMTKYVSQNQSESFRYYVSQDDGMPLQVKQLPDRVFSLTNIQSIESMTITAARFEIDGATTQMADIWCHWKNPETDPIPEMRIDDIVTDQTGEKVYLQNLSPLYCSDLWVGDKQIFVMESGIIDIAATDVTLSADGKWMLFKHDTDNQHNGNLSPDEVYLIDLR